ncbi:DUF1722 domain-containing protein [Alteribacter lacisalsi]|uniref:DUF1722 domain-containing protein n=1 Tax=Alteribacter lacisalsi TaxID=2045244 RepID=UPI001374B4FC|nr:DUF1722 domain-containing protein [Alteribacter lacisalsi]
MDKKCRKLIEALWSVNKYDVMARGYSHYKEVQKQLRSASDCSDCREVYLLISSLRTLPYSHPDVINTLEHMWGYFRKTAADDRKDVFLHCLERAKGCTAGEYTSFPPEVRPALGNLSLLLEIYPDSYLKQSSFFKPVQHWNRVTVNDTLMIVNKETFQKNGM